jgi:hypothetical protein
MPRGARDARLWLPSLVNGPGFAGRQGCAGPSRWSCTEQLVNDRLPGVRVAGRSSTPLPGEGPPYRAIRAAMKRANADQVVTNWIQLIVKYFSRPASQFGGIASGFQANITL